MRNINLFECKRSSEVAVRVSQFHGGLLRLLVPTLAVLKLPPDFLSDLVVVVDPHDLKQRLLLLRADVLLVPLDKGEEGLVPQHGQDSLLTAEVEEVEDT